MPSTFPGSSSDSRGRLTNMALGLVGGVLLLLAAIQPWQSGASQVFSGPLLLPKDSAAAVLTYQRWGFIFAAVLWFLFLTVKLGWRENAHCKVHTDPAQTKASWRMHLCALVGIVLVLIGTRHPLLNRDITMDEQYDLSTAVHGVWHSSSPMIGRVAKEQLIARPQALEASARAEWRPASWTDTLNRCTSGSNSPMFSAITRVCHNTALSLSGAALGSVNLVAMRLPALVFAGLAAGLMWIGAWRMGGVWAAIFTTAWLLMHPLFIRFSAEARCYTLVLCLALLALWHLTKALALGLWRNWLVMQLCAAGLLYVFPGTLYLVALLQVVAIAILLGRLFRKIEVARARDDLRMWLACGLAAASLLMAVALPSLVTRYVVIRDFYLIPESFPGWWMQTWNVLATGLSWPQFDVVGGMTDPDSWQSWWRLLTGPGMNSFPLPLLLSLVFLPILMVAGTWRLARRKDKAALLHGVIPVLAAVLSVLHHIFITGYLPLYWYFIFALPGLAILAAAGLGLLPREGAPQPRWPLGLVALVYLGVWAWAGWPDHRPGRLEQFPPSRKMYIAYQRGGEIWVTNRQTLRTTRHTRQ